MSSSSSGTTTSPKSCAPWQRIATLAGALSLAAGLTLIMTAPFTLAPETEPGVSYGLIGLTLALHLSNIFFYLRPSKVTETETNSGIHHEMQM